MQDLTHTLTMIIDESGPKGYSDNHESKVGDLGVMAGFLIPDEYLSIVKSELNSIRGNFLTNGKLHITHLEASDQQKLRAQIFEYFRTRHIYWVYEAIYVEGFFHHAEHLRKEIDKARKLLTEAKVLRESDVSISSHEKRDLLHSKLFLGVFGKGVAFCMDCLGSKIILNIVTDRVDKPILKKFCDEADRLLRAGEKETANIPGYYDWGSKKPVKREKVTEVIAGRDALGDFSGVSYELIIADSTADLALTLAADVLANSVYHHLEGRQAGFAGKALNERIAIQGHPLESLVYGVSEAYFADKIYNHPLQFVKRDQNDT